MVSFLFLMMFAFSELQSRLCGGTSASAEFRVLLLLTICLLSYLGGLLYARRTGSPAVIRILLWIYFLLYLYLILTFTLMDESLRLNRLRLSDDTVDARAYYLQWFVNLCPFRSIYEVYIHGFFNGYVNARYMLLNLLGNICAFMPFAYFLPAFFPTQKKWWVFLSTVLLIVTCIEALQFCFMSGSCDIDDLILNAGGAFLLYLLLKIPPIRRFCEGVGTGFGAGPEKQT